MLAQIFRLLEVTETGAPAEETVEELTTTSPQPLMVMPPLGLLSLTVVDSRSTVAPGLQMDPEPEPAINWIPFLPVALIEPPRGSIHLDRVRDDPQAGRARTLGKGACQDDVVGRQVDVRTDGADRPPLEVPPPCRASRTERLEARERPCLTRDAFESGDNTPSNSSRSFSMLFFQYDHMIQQSRPDGSDRSLDKG